MQLRGLVKLLSVDLGILQGCHAGGGRDVYNRELAVYFDDAQISVAS